MHSNYHIDYILKLKIKHVSKMLIEALKKQSEGKAWDLYLIRYSQMDKDSYMTFDEFYRPQVQVEQKSEEEILKEVKNILDSF